MTVSTRKRNGPLSHLRQTILSLPTTNNNLPLVLFLSALTLIVRNNRLKHFVKDSGRIKDFSTDNLQYLVKALGEQLKSLAGSTAISLDFQENNGEVWKSIWHSLQSKHLDSLWTSETTLGYIYQFLCLPQRTLSLSQLAQSDKTIDASTLIAFTQLYTPDWVADYLLQNTIMPQWRAKTPANHLTVLDPACGAGHFLVRAFNLLSELYIAEGASEQEACRSIIKHNLYGTDIDERSLAVAGLSLLVRILKTSTATDVQPLNFASANNANQPDNMLGSLNRQWSSSHPLSKQYSTVVTNPPYIGRKLLDRSLKQSLKTNYPNSHNDLANAFLERCIELCQPAGMVGVITQASIISLPSYTALRKSLLEKTIDTCVELGPGVFPLQGGEKINSILLVVRNSPFKSQSKHTARFIDLTEAKDKAVALQQSESDTNHYEISQNTLADNTDHVFNYRAPSIVHKFLSEAKPLSSLAEVRQGLATTDNGRFLRYWWDVDSHLIGKRWFPYAKGAGVKRWHNPIKHLVNWQNDGQEIKDAVTSAYPYLKGKSAWVVKNEKYYFREGLTFSFIGGQDLAVRYLPAGCIFDVAGSAIFVDDQAIFCYLAYLNSSFIRALAGSLNPSINFQVGDLKKLPLLNFSKQQQIRLAEAAQKCFAIKEWLDGFDPTVFKSDLPNEITGILKGHSIEAGWRSYVSKQQQATNELASLEEEVNHIVLEAVAQQWSLNQTDLKILTNWIDKSCRPGKVSESTLDSLAFAKTSLYHLLQKYLQENSLLTFAVEEIDQHIQFDKENTAWLCAQLKQPIGKYLTEKFMLDQTKQFGGSPRLFCQPIEGNGHAVLFSTQALRDIQAQRNLPMQKTTDITQLKALAAKMSQTADWTGRQLLSCI